MTIIQKITPNLWFDTQAEAAAKFYCAIFSNSGITRTTYYGIAGYDIHKMQEGTVMTVTFELDGCSFTALNGGPVFKFSEAISFIINCHDQEEVDYYWNSLSAGGDERAQQCGWLKDKFGVSWQVVPTILSDMMADENRERADRVMVAMLKMKKIEIDKLRIAYNGVTEMQTEQEGELAEA